jgi:hypothetical protein
VSTAWKSRPRALRSALRSLKGRSAARILVAAVVSSAPAGSSGGGEGGWRWGSLDAGKKEGRSGREGAVAEVEGDGRDSAEARSLDEVCVLGARRLSHSHGFRCCGWTWLGSN